MSHACYLAHRHEGARSRAFPGLFSSALGSRLRNLLTSEPRTAATGPNIYFLVGEYGTSTGPLSSPMMRTALGPAGSGAGAGGLGAAAAELRLPINVPNPAHAQFISRESTDPREETKALSLGARQRTRLAAGQERGPLISSTPKACRVIFRHPRRRRVTRADRRRKLRVLAKRIDRCRRQGQPTKHLPRGKKRSFSGTRTTQLPVVLGHF